MRTETHWILSVPLRDDHVSFVREGEGMEKIWLLGEGVPYAPEFPAGATIDVDADHKGTRLDDFINNSLRWLVVTERVKDLLVDEPVKAEVFPLGIRNRKGKLVDRPYFLVNLLGTVDCIDLNASRYVRSRVDPEQIQIVEKLVLDPARIPADRPLFRLKGLPSVFIIRSDLVARLREAGITGFELLELNSPILI